MHFQVCNGLHVQYCNIHDNLRGNFAFGSNDVYIDKCNLNKYTSKSIWVPVESGTYPRYAGGTDYMIDVEDAVCNKLTISNCVIKSDPKYGSIIGSKLLRFYFHHNRVYNCGIGCPGVYEEVIANNVFYGGNVFSYGSGRYEESIYTVPVYRNSIYSNNVYYNAYIHDFGRIIDKYHNVNIDNCVIHLTESSPNPGEMNFNKTQKEIKKNILKPNADSSNIVFNRCTFIGTENTSADCYLGVVNNSKFIKGKNYYVRELNNVEIDGADIRFQPTSKNVDILTLGTDKTVVITINANAVKGISLENTIQNGFYTSDMVDVATETTNTKCIINFNFTNCEVELRNSVMEAGMIPGYYSDSYHKCIASINYMFNGCLFSHKTLGNMITNDEYPLVNCF